MYNFTKCNTAPVASDARRSEVACARCFNFITIIADVSLLASVFAVLAGLISAELIIVILSLGILLICLLILAHSFLPRRKRTVLM